MTEPHFKRLAVVITLVLLVLAASFFLTASPFSRTPAPMLHSAPTPAPPANPTTITWSPNSIEAVVSPGATKSIAVTFVASKNIRRASVEISPTLVGFVSATPSSFERIRKGERRPLNLIITSSAGSPLGTVTGLIQMRKGKVENGDDDGDPTEANKLLPQKLKVTVNVWNTLTDTSAGFSVFFPPSLYNLTDANTPPNTFDLQSSPNGVDIGGAMPGGSPASTSGFAIGIDATLYSTSNSFDINQYLATEYPNSAADANVTPITVCGKPGYQIFFSGEETGNWPVAIAYQSGNVYRFLYSSTDYVSGFSDQVGLKAFNDVLVNCTLGQ